MAKPGSVIGWKLDRAQREILLDRFPPRYPHAIADHVTLRTDASGQSLPDAANGRIIGHADDDEGLEAMVVAIDGTSDRPDGSVFHITWSLDKTKGREARESNDLLKTGRWQPLDPVDLELKPARFP